MEEVKVIITTNAPISVKVVQNKSDGGYAKLAARLKESEGKSMLLVKEKMAEVMEDKNINSKHLMHILGVSRSCVNHYLNGRLRIPLARARLLIDYFGAEAIAYATDWEAMNASCPF